MALGVSGFLASVLLTGCSPDGDVIDADYAQVCQDRTTEVRVEDNRCSQEGRAAGHYGWYFYNMGGSGSGTTVSIPGVGSKLSGGTASVPAGKSVKSGVSVKGGGTVSRGGFGTSAKGAGMGG